MKTKFHPIRVWTACSVLVVALIAALFLVSRNEAARPQLSHHTAQHSVPDKAQREQIARDFGQLPLSFEANRGQTAKNVDFVARGGGYTMFLAPTQATLSLKKASASTVLRMNLLGANANARSSGAQMLPGKVNYLLGKDRSKWRTGIETYQQVLYDEVYRGIDLIYYGQQRQLEYDFVVKPGASPQTIQLGFGGAEKVRLDERGDLILHAKGGQVRWQRPIAYQKINGARRLVDARYELGKAQRVSFAVGAYDKTRPLIIDPILLYSTYLGGTGNDQARAIALDSAGSIYLAGETTSLDFPNAQNSSGGATEAFVTKLNASASQVLFSTYVGGTGIDRARGIALDFGSIYLAGETASANFPTQNPQQATFGGGASDGFVTRLSADGTVLFFSTYLGGTAADSCLGIALDGTSNSYVTGQTASNDFVTSSGALQTAYAGGASDAFVSKFDVNGANLYSTYLGGAGADVGNAIIINSSGTTDIAGATASTDFPISGSGAFQFSNAGGNDAFYTRLDTTQTGFGGLLYSTYFGSSGDDEALAIVTDSNNYSYLTGTTTSTTLPFVSTPAQGSNGGGTDAFIASFDPANFSSSLRYTTFLGGSGNDAGRGIGVDGIGNAYIAGDTTSTDFPTQNPLQATHAPDGGLRDAFASKLDSTGSVLAASTYFGGNGDDSANALALSAGDVILSGVTASTNLPVTTGVAQPTKNTGTDAFLSKLSFGTSFVVTNANDAGAGSLRQAIFDADSSPGTDTITFNIPGTGVQTITLASPLPSFDDPVIVDGYSQPNSAPNTLANGTNAQILIDINGNGNVGLYVVAPNCQFRGLVLRNFEVDNAAIEFADSGGGNSGQNSQISGCFIGTNADGVTEGIPVGITPGNGIQTTNTNTITIGGPNLADRNLISGNANGVSLFSRNNTVLNNLIGTQRDGETALPNRTNGVAVQSGTANIIGNANFALGNVIAGNAVYGIYATASNNSVLNNRIGVSATQQALGNGDDGIRFEGEDNSIISGNLIGSNGGDGIDIERLDLGGGFFNNATSNTIVGNFIGTNGQNSNRGNVGNGIQLGIGAGQANIGQSGTNNANVIGFNGINGVIIVGAVNNAVTFVRFRNNFIGVAGDGSTALPNQSAGISASNAISTFIGSASSGDANVISGNGGNGIQFVDSNFADIKNNFIGTNASGDATVSNGGNGIISIGSTDLIIGGTNGRNVIGGNGSNGISLFNTSTSSVQGNSIGTNATGSAVLGNGGNGVAVQGFNNLIGGIGAGEGNIVAFNGATGVSVSVGGGSSGNPIRRNAIFLNGALGIDEGTAGVTANDTPDSDGVQNFPVITSARTFGTSTTIVGSLSSVANTNFALDFFSNTVADPTGFGEGQTFIGSQNVTSDSTGNAPFSFNVAPIPIGSFITATATRIVTTSDTGEFSQAVAVTTPAFSINDVSIAEGNSGTSNAVFTVTLANPNVGTATVNYATANGTATAPADYTTTSGTLTFAPGVTTQTISVPIIGDTNVEANETFTVTLSGATNATIARATGTGTIVNDDLPSLSINSGSVNEGNSGTTNANFTVTLSQASPLTVTVDFATADGTATAPSDYTSTSGTVTFAPGQTTRPITIPVIGDTVVEPDETFTVNLSNPVNATISQTPGTGTIVNDDVSGFSINDVVISEGDQGTTNAVFTVTLSPPNIGTSTVNFATADGTASAPADYTSTSGTLTFAPGVVTQTINVPIIGDTLTEPNETFTVTLSGAVNATIARATGTGTIRNDDAPALALSIAPGTITEGGAAATGTVTRNAATTSALTVQINNNNPLRVSTPSNVVIAAGSTTATFSIASIDNALADGNATVTITVAAAGFSDDSANVVVQDDDVPTLTLTIAPSTFSEATGARAARGDVTRNTSTSTPLTVALATNNPNKVRLPATVTIPAGSSATSFVVGAVDNQISDGDSNVLIRASAANFTSSTQTVIVTDNDTPQSSGSSVVINTNDSGIGSLRSALDFANSNPGTTISFRIPPGDANFTNGVWQIRLRQALPPLTAAGTNIDGNTQTSAAGNTNRRGPEIMLDGSLLATSSGAGADGLQIRAARCGLRGLIISGFGGSGVDISGATAFNNTLQGNYLGTDATGTLKTGNGTSVLQSAGVRIAGGAHDNLIGGPGTAARNIIAGNTFDGVLITGAGSDNNRVQSNFLGTVANGTSALANGAAGVHLDGGAQNNLIGGPSPSVRNLISGNTFSGVLITGTGTSNNIVQGNAIGTDASGDGDIGNLLHGIDVQGGQSTVIGTGTNALNARAPATTNGNLIAFNRTDGVHVDGAAQGVSIRGNLIFENGALGINLARENDLSNGVTLNDAGDADSGPNTLQNFPVLSGVQPTKTSTGIATALSGTLNSAPNGDFVIDFYRSTQDDDSGYGEGGFYLGSVAARTNGAGNAAFRFNANGDLRGLIFTATATALADGSTSEFGPSALQISGFEPKNGPVGTQVTIRGAGFRGVTNVFFNGVPSTFSNDSQTEITALVPAGATSGPIRVTTADNQTQSTDNFTVVARPSNDDFENAQVLAGPRGSVRGSNINASAQAGEPAHAENDAERSVWYRWTAPASGIAVFDTQDSTFDTVLAVYTGSAVNALQLIAEDDDGGMADDSRVRFRTVAGQTYSIAVDGYEGDQGAVALRWMLTPVRPPNDNFARAEVLNGARGNVDGSNLGATKEAGEPDHAGDSGGHSIWYRWTAPDNGTATFGTKDSDFDTLLAVYVGNSVDALQLVAENDDGADAFHSLVSFEARRGQTYFIAVDGYDGDEGIVTLRYVLGSAGGGIIRWARPVSGNWNNPDNWRPADGRPRVPGPGDLAIIDLDGNYTVNLDVDATVSGLNLGARNGQQVLAIRNNTLTLDGRSRVEPNGVLDLGDAGINVQSDLFIGGLLRWSGGKLRGEGTLQVERTGTIGIEGSADKVLSINNVRSFGALNWRGNGDIIAGNGTIFLNYGTFSILNDATLRWDGIGDIPAIFNYNVFSKSQSNGVTLFSGVQLWNQERAFLRSGTLRLRGGGTSYGTFDIVTGSRLEFTSAYFFAKESSSFSGGGDAVLIDGTFTIDTSGKPVTVSNFQLVNGFIFGASEQSTLNAEDFTWTGGGMRGKGMTNVSGDLSIGGTNNKTLSGRALNNNGQANWSGSGDIVGSDGALFDNNGTLNTGDEQDFTFDSGDPNIFNNDGTLNIGNAPETPPANAPVNARRDLQPRAGIALPTGIFNMFGSYNQAAAGILNMDIGGTTPGATYDQLNVNGPANLNGTLNVRLGAGFTPKDGDVFRVVGYQARQGTFNINIANLPPGITLEAIYTPNALELRVASGTNPPPAISKIEGRITRLNGDAFPNVRVELSDQNGKVLAAQTGANGEYRFNDVPNGSYTITPQAAGFEWNPPTRSLQIGQSSQISGADFIGLIAPSISGRLVDSSGAGIPNVTMRLTRSGGGAAVTAQSNSNGFYGFEALAAGTYGVVPSMNAVLFSPPFLPATVSATKGVGNVNFLGTPFGSNVQIASLSPVKLSSANANASQVLLNFTGALDNAAATDAEHYLVMVNDHAIEIESIEYRSAKNSVILNLAGNHLHTGEVVSVRWQNLRDSHLQVLAGGTTARAR